MSYYGRDRRASSGEYTPLNTFETQNGESKDLLSKKAVFSPKLTMVGALSPIRSRSNTLRQSFDTNQSQASPHDDANLSRNQAEKVRSMSGSPKTLDGFLPYQRSNSLSGNSSSMLLLSDKARSSERNESAELVSLRDKITPTRRSSYGAVEVTMPKDAISVPQPTNKIEIRSSKINGTSPNDQGTIRLFFLLLYFLSTFLCVGNRCNS